MAALLKLRSTTEPLRLEYDATHYVPFAVASDGSLTVTPTGTSGAVMPWKWAQTDGIVQQFPTTEAGRAFNITLKSFPNDPAAGGREDWVMRWGYNIAAGGGRSNAADHSIAWEIENYWYQTGAGYWTEVHLAYTSKNDAGTRRLQSWLTGVNDDTCTAYFQADSFEFRDFSVGGGVGVFSINALAGTIGTSAIYKHTVNDADIIQGAMAGGGFTSMLKVNAANEVELGNATIASYVPKTFRVGASSGGTTGALVEVVGNLDAAISEPLILRQNGNSAGSGVAIKMRAGTASNGRIGWDGYFFYERAEAATPTTYVRHMRVYQDLELLIAGKGLIVKTPDGAHTYRIAVSNAGAITSTMVT